MRTLNVEVICPSTSRSYDYKIPPEIKAKDIKTHLISDIRKFEGISDLFENEKTVRLFSEYGSEIFDENTLSTAGIKSGDRLMIV